MLKLRFCFFLIYRWTVKEDFSFIFRDRAQFAGTSKYYPVFSLEFFQPFVADCSKCCQRESTASWFRIHQFPSLAGSVNNCPTYTESAVTSAYVLPSQYGPRWAQSVESGFCRAEGQKNVTRPTGRNEDKMQIGRYLQERSVHRS